MTKNINLIVQFWKPYIFVPIGSLFFCRSLRWTRACRQDSPQAWSWRCACALRLTVLTGWPTSSPHVASCCCYATRDTKMTVAPTSGVTSWRRISTRWAGAGSMGRPWGPLRVRSGWCWNVWVFVVFLGGVVVVSLYLFVWIFFFFVINIWLPTLNNSLPLLIFCP